ncbi:hypothetical protein MNBD_GAMMA09-1333 [hydrothermal vent metagenome]|uniref:Uncharacterized protein n=1 Tax=hydrothermal vent metagenome TaxID=652676 RepID=A0A3B0X7A6_9ZZZZ
MCILNCLNVTLRTIAITTLLLTLFSGCDIEVGDNLPGVPPNGRFAAVGANQHSGITETQVAIAIFDNGKPAPLIGGDVVQASTRNDSILLLDEGFYKGSYVADLPNNNNLNQIDFLVVHETVKAREGRWYPADLLNIDPGPGEFVGASASITLPAEPANLATDRDIFSNINETFTLTWSPDTAGDTMQVRAAISCTDGTNTDNYGTVATLTDNSDDGTEVISINQFIYDTNDLNPSVTFISGKARAMLQKLLTQLNNATTVSNDFFANLKIINPAFNDCNIRLFLFREREGSFDLPATNGNISSSRSAETTLSYKPN